LEEVFVNDGLALLLEEWRDDWDNYVVHLFTDDSTQHGRATELADLVEPTFTGYAPVPIGDPVGDVFDNTNGDKQFNCPTKVFTCSADSAAESIVGWFVTDAASGTLVAYCEYSDPITIVNTVSTCLTPTVRA